LALPVRAAASNAARRGSSQMQEAVELYMVGELEKGRHVTAEQVWRDVLLAQFPEEFPSLSDIGDKQRARRRRSAIRATQRLLLDMDFSFTFPVYKKLVRRTADYRERVAWLQDWSNFLQRVRLRAHVHSHACTHTFTHVRVFAQAFSRARARIRRRVGISMLAHADSHAITHPRT